MNELKKLSLPPGPLTQAYTALHKVYVETRRHQEAIDALKRTLLGGVTSGGHSGLALIGPTGSGKSATVKYVESWLRTELGLPEASGSPLPVVLLTTRSTGRTLANNILRAGRDPLAGTRTQDDAETHIRETSPDMEVVGFALDEFHHAFSAKSESESHRMSLTLKTLVNSLSKPVVVMGVDGLEDFLDGNSELRQRFERRVYLTDPTISSHEDMEDTRKLLKALKEVLPQEPDCDLDSREMLGRLLYAANGRFGSIVNLVRSACAFGAMARQEKVSMQNFVAAYREVAPRNKRENQHNAFLMSLESVKPLLAQMQSKRAGTGVSS